MGTRTLRWLAAALAIAIVTLLCWPEPDPAPNAAATPTARHARVPAVRGQVPAPKVTERRTPGSDRTWLDELSGREERLRADDNDPHAVVIRGRLTVRQRHWLHPAGITVRLTRSFLDTVVPTDAGEQDELTPATDDPVTTTDAEGRFAFRFAPTTGELFFLIDQGGRWMDFQRVRDVPRLGGDLDLGDVFLDDRGGVIGTVVDGRGLPVRGVTVRSVDDPLLAGGVSELGELRQPRNHGAEQLQLPGTLTSGPIPDWVVRRDKFLPFPKAATDGAGRFRLRGLRPGTHDLYLQSDMWQGRVADVQIACGRDTEVGHVQLAMGEGIRIEFKDDEGRPWVDAEIALIDRDVGFGPRSIRTDRGGRIRALVTPGRAYRVAFGYPGGGPWIVLGDLPQRGHMRVMRPRETTMTLVSATDRHRIRGGKVRFVVQGEAFRPVDRRLPASLQPRERRDGVHAGRSPCQVIAIASAPGHAPAIAAIDAGSHTDLTMLPLATVTVRTRDKDGQPVPGAAVRIQAHEHPEHKDPGMQWTLLANDRILAGRTDENGLLVVPVWDTLLSFAADHPDFAMSAGPRLCPTPGETIDLLLRKNGSLRGQLTFHQRAAPAGYRVRARLRPPLGHELATSGWLTESIAVTGDDGAFAFRNLDAGIWELDPELPKIPTAAGPTSITKDWRTKQVSLEEGQELYVTLEAQKHALSSPQLTGTITLDGAQVSGAVVRVRELKNEGSKTRQRRRSRREDRAPMPTAEPWTQRMTTNAFGDFVFADLKPASDYEVRVDVPSAGRLQFVHRSVGRTPKAHSTQPTKLDIAITSGTLRLYATRGDKPYKNGMLRLRQTGPNEADLARYELLTTAEGECYVPNLPVGTWTVEPMHGGRCHPPQVTITAGGVALANVRIVGR